MCKSFFDSRLTHRDGLESCVMPSAVALHEKMITRKSDPRI